MVKTRMLEQFLAEAVKPKDQAKIDAAKQILDTKQPFERYCMNRLISDGISRGSQAVVVNFSIKPSKFKGCYDISYSDTVDHIRSSTTIYKDPEMGVIRVLKEDPDGKDRAVYVGRNADRIARYMSACCDRALPITNAIQNMIVFCKLIVIVPMERSNSTSSPRIV